MDDQHSGPISVFLLLYLSRGLGLEVDPLPTNSTVKRK
jgi:hypothetical protein